MQNRYRVSLIFTLFLFYLNSLVLNLLVLNLLVAFLKKVWYTLSVVKREP